MTTCVQERLTNNVKHDLYIQAVHLIITATSVEELEKAVVFIAGNITCELDKADLRSYYSQAKRRVQ